MNSYEPPAIVRLAPGHTNKFGGRPAPTRMLRLDIDGAKVTDLVREHGSPLFVFSARTLVRQVRRVRDALRSRYDNAVLAWSYKTNHLPAVCALMHREGSLAEVVSALEYAKARAQGVPGKDIILNGPMKPMDLLRQAAAEGALIHADHVEELDDLAQVAAEQQESLGIGIRLNIDAGIQPQWSRFGFSLENGEALAAVERIARDRLLRLTSLHCHLGTFILDPAAYGRQVEKMLAFAYQLEDRFGFRLTTLDLGGGLPSRNRLKGTWQSPDVSVPPPEEYTDAIGEALARCLRPGHRPRVVCEHGRGLIDEAGFLITSSVAAKRLPDGTPAYVLDGGVNLLYTATWYAFDVRLGAPVPGTPVPTVLYGPLCMNIDVVSERAVLPPLPRGTPLVIGPVGAYSVTQWMQFIHARPAVVMVMEDGEVEVIREAEGLEDWTFRERLPEGLESYPGALFTHLAEPAETPATARVLRVTANAS